MMHIKKLNNLANTKGSDRFLVNLSLMKCGFGFTVGQHYLNQTVISGA